MLRRLFLLLLFVCLSFGAWAQPGPIDPNFQEQQALADIDAEKFVHLRELTRKMMEDPSTRDRFQTFYFMGVVLHNGEGDLPRAKWYLDEAIKRFDTKYGNPPDRSAPWGWLEKMIFEQAGVTGEMDLYQDQIDTWKRLDALYAHIYGMPNPVVNVFYSWPLMKLGKEQQARDALRRAMVSDSNELVVVQVLNSLGALEMETDHPQACYRAFQKLVQEVRRHGWPMTNTYLRNAGEAAGCLLRFDEAERYFLEATEIFDPNSFSNPWWDLASLYLSQARFPESVSALKKCHKWTFDSAPKFMQQSWAANQQLTCEILLQLGMTEHAYRIAQAFIDRPDRKGGDSVQRDQWEAANMMIFREAALARRQALQEEMLWTKGWAWWKLLWAQRDLAWQAYLKGQQAASTIVSHGRIHSALRYAYAPGTVLVPNYVRVELATLLGPGTTLAALDELEAKNFESLELERPYLNTIRFEALARLGRNGEAMTLLDKIEETLPASERLLKTRVLARAAQICQSAGEEEKAMRYLQQVMAQAPGMLRQLHIALPVQFKDDGSAVAQSVVSMCRRSPRFTEAASGFSVEVSASGARLLDPNQNILAQVQLGPLKKGEEPASVLTRNIHDRFFAAQIDLSQLDIGSLDGVVTGAVQSKQMQEMFFPGSTRQDDEGK